MKQLLQYFPQLSLHPDNLPELRGLILQLAVTGKLTAEWRKENPNVEPASELLARVRAEKAELVKAKKIKKSKMLSPVSAEEAPFEIPMRWVWCHLEETGFTQTGSTPPKKEPSYFGDHIPFLSPAHISDSGMDYPKDGLSEKGLAKGRFITKGSLLMVCIGGSIGKCNITDRDVSCNQQINTLTPITNDSSYIKIACQASFFQKAVAEKSGGSATPIINKSKWESLPIPLPPLPEQKAIVQTVAALLQALDQLQQRTEARLRLKADYATAALRRLTTAPDASAAWQALAPHFHSFFNEAGSVQALRAAILQLAVQGKLTAHWRKAHPDVEPASELLARIRAEKAELVKAKKIKKEQPLPAVDEEEVPFVVPAGWVWCRLGEISSIKGGKRVPKGYKLLHTPTPYIYIRVTDMKDGTIKTSDLRYISEEVHQKIKKYTISKDDLYLTIAGTIGEVGEIPQELDGMNLTENAAKIQFSKFNKYYLKTILSSIICQNQFLEKVNKMAQPKLALQRIKSTLIPLPPLPEQAAIVQTVEALLGLCTELEAAAGRREAVLGDWVGSVVRF